MRWAALLLGLVGVCVVGVLASIVPNKISPAKCELPCYNGLCKNGTCICGPGWTGRQCESCFGRIKLSSSRGVITDGPRNYSKNLRCSWLIDGGMGGGKRISLKLNSFVTECGWDHMYIYDGDGMYGTQLAALSGIMTPLTELSNGEFRAETGQAFLYFYSDLAYNMSGFNISYEYNECPGNCHGRGVCESETGLCNCTQGWGGDACERPSCPNNCSKTGTCNPTTNTCTCIQGYHGVDCSTRESEGVWEEVGVGEGGSRASHSVALVGEDMWVAGGISFQGYNFSDLAKFNVVDKSWSDVVVESGERPAVRYDHSLVEYRGSLLMFGGVIEQKNISSQLWSFDITSRNWTLLTPEHHSHISLPYHTAGHTAHVVGNVMVVIFGYNQYRGYINTVQEYYLLNGTWNVPKTSSCSVKGSYGHSSVYDPKSGFVFVFGGYHGNSLSTGAVLDRLLKYDPILHEWSILASSGYHLFRHAAGMIGGLMVVVGGNAHNDTTPSIRTKCYANFILAYDTQCEQWYNVKSTCDASPGHARYGHSIVTHRDHLYVYGGFNGRMLSNVIRFQPGSCGFARDEQTCYRLRGGRKCVWESRGGKEGACVEWRGAEESRSAILKGCDYEDGVGRTRGCAEVLDCRSCLSADTSSSCYWCENFCTDSCTVKQSQKFITRVGECPVPEQCCSYHHTCVACGTDPKCRWTTRAKAMGECVERTDTDGVVPPKKGGDHQVGKKKGQEEEAMDPSTTSLPVNVCPPPCSHFSSCTECGDHGCMWCSTMSRCVAINAYMASFPYGQCTEWSSSSGERRCLNPTNCSAAQTCSQCEEIGPRCGWCDDGSRTGLGRCMEGGADGPVFLSSLTGHYSRNESACPNPRWYFFDCPACQCNGHGFCNETEWIGVGAKKELKCDVCEGDTVGPHCDTCKRGFYGNALNGGNCTECECNGKATDCDPLSGDCFCTTKGVSGKHCDKCDQRYVGNPKNQTCFYELSVDFIFTFKLDDNDPKDKYVNQINFVTIPTKQSTDVIFKLTCNGSPAKVNLTVESGDSTRRFFAKLPCSEIERKFADKDFHFGTEANTTFYVYLYDFRTPVVIQISFAQTPPIDWVRFFITFACCFISLLFVAAVFWKVKLSVDLYRRRQRMYVEMANMASRPFGSMQLELSGPGVQNKVHPSPVSVEPCGDYKAAIVTVAVRLPTGGKKYAPSGQSGLAVASALCYLTPAQISVLQTPPSPTPEQKSKRRRPSCLS